MFYIQGGDMEEIANKMKVLELQDEKTILMKREVDIEDQICDLQDRLDLVMREKSDLDRNNREIEEKIETFNKQYQVFQGKQKDIMSKVGKGLCDSTTTTITITGLSHREEI